MLVTNNMTDMSMDLIALEPKLTY